MQLLKHDSVKMNIFSNLIHVAPLSFVGIWTRLGVGKVDSHWCDKKLRLRGYDQPMVGASS